MGFVRLNAVFLPDKGLEEKVLSLARQVAGGGDEIFHIDNRRFFAHLTIYSPEYPEENVSKVYDEVEALAGKLTPFKLSFLDFNAVDGFVGARFAKTALAEMIHRQIVERLNPLRDGHIREKYLKELEGNYSPQQRELIKRFGSPLVFDFYQPHLTLARLVDNREAQSVVAELNSRDKLPLARITKMAVAAMGPNGTCTKIIETFGFG
jgi:2'-5' RNA ligase